MPKKSGTQDKKKATQKIPNIVSFDEFVKLKGVQSEPLTIYFNEQLWKDLTKGIRPVEGKLPKKGLRLALFTTPSIPGGFGSLSSGSNLRFVLPGGGVVLPDPSGADKPNPEDPRVPDPRGEIFEGQLAQCGMVFSSTRPVLQCAGWCSAGRCRMVIYTENQGGRWQSMTIVCECRR